MASAARKLAPSRKPINLNLGSGIGLLKDFINIDILPLSEIKKGWKTKKGFYAKALIQPNAEYRQCSITDLPFPDNYADYAFMSEVLEHFPIRIVQPALNEIYRVMKPGSMLVTTTPDFNTLAQMWLDNVGNKVGTFEDFQLYKYIGHIIYGGQQHDGEFHRCPMTPDFVNYIHRVAGFREVKVQMWPFGQKPAKRYKGMFWKKNSVMRTTTIVTEAIK